MELGICENIDDPDLILHWKRIEEQYDYFPQSSYGWCSAWWKLRGGGKRQLHVVTVTDGDMIVGIAPLCIEKFGIFKVLHSFPIHFGDFYDFIIDKQYPVEEIISLILRYLKTFQRWQLVRIDQVNSEEVLYKFLSSNGLVKKKLTDIIITEFKGRSFEEYIQSRTKNLRKNLRKKKRLLLKSYRTEFVKAQTMDSYLRVLPDIKDIYDARWGISLSARYYKMRNQALEPIFERRKAVAYVLYANDHPFAFRIGFLKGKTYYDWKTAFDPSFKRYSPGDMIMAHIAEDLLSNGYESINFMAGGYDFKKRWARDGRTTENFSFFLGKDSAVGKILVSYNLFWRDKLKNLLNENPRLRNFINHIRRRYSF